MFKQKTGSAMIAAAIGQFEQIIATMREGVQRNLSQMDANGDQINRLADDNARLAAEVNRAVAAASKIESLIAP